MAKQNFTSNAFQLKNLTKFGTRLEYQCPRAREFFANDTSTVKSQNISCLWNQTWSPGVTFPSCVCKFLFAKKILIIILDTSHML